MIPNPIRKVLSSIQKYRVRALLMGGQARVFYSAAKFSRDTDLAILADAAKPQPTCAKRVECVELAPAFKPPPPCHSARQRPCAVRLFSVGWRLCRCGSGWSA